MVAVVAPVVHDAPDFGDAGRHRVQGPRRQARPDETLHAEDQCRRHASSRRPCGSGTAPGPYQTSDERAASFPA